MQRKNRTALLVVEDNVPLARAIARHMRRAGYLVTLTHSAADALDIKSSFACAIMDVDLPDASGVDVARRLLARGAVAKVVFFTASAGAQARIEGADLGKVVDKREGVVRLRQIIDESLRPCSNG